MLQLILFGWMVTVMMAEYSVVLVINHFSSQNVAKET